MENQPIIDIDNLAALTPEQQEYLEEPVLQFIGANAHDMDLQALDIHIAKLRAMMTGAEGVKRAIASESAAIRDRKPRQTSNQKKVANAMKELW